jgi:hypothetical protein
MKVFLGLALVLLWVVFRKPSGGSISREDMGYGGPWI